MSVNKEKSENNKEGKLSFFEKMQDKKYKAKVELILGFGAMFLFIIYASITGVGNNYDYNYTNTSTTKSTSSETKESTTTVLDKVSDNYSFKININLTKKNQTSDNASDVSLTEYNYSYNGKRNANNTIIDKTVDGATLEYYKIDDEYYSKNEDDYVLASVSNIYDLIDEKYINIDNIKNYIANGSLDHTTNYSSGKVSYVYTLNVRDIIKTYTEDDIIQIQIDVEENIPVITIDYTNLMRVLDENINECKVDITYTDVGNVEEFKIMDESSSDN